MGSILFSLKGLSSSHYSFLRRSSWHEDLSILMVRGESSRRISPSLDRFTSLSKHPAAAPRSEAHLFCCLVLTPCLPPLPKLILPPQETLGLLPHGIYRVKNILTTCATSQNESFTFTSETLLPPFSLFFFHLPFCLFLLCESVPGAQSAGGTIGSVTECSVAMLWCQIERLLKTLGN